jgi:hypothetical protein
LFGTGNAGNDGAAIRFNGSDQLEVYEYLSGSFYYNIVSTQVFRDPSSFGHLVVSVDTSQATSSNRVKIYWNGAQITTFGTATYPSLDYQGEINTAVAHGIGRGGSYNDLYFNGYLADVHFIDGQALTPSSFTEVSATTGQLIPKAYTGSFGTNGFWLKFSDNSAATATTLGKDYSGNGNNWTPNNLSVTAGAGNDSLVDTPTSYGTDTGAGGEVRGNYATLNPLIYGGSISAPTNGNLDISSGSSYGTIYATIGANSGKWYWEFTNTSTGSNGSCVGIAAAGATLSSDAGAYSKGYIYCSGALKANNNSYGSYGASWNTSGDIIGVAFDSDNGTLTFYKNGSSQGQAYSGIASTTEYYFPVFADASGSASGGGSFNFGQRPFAYTAPSGFKALCDTNLPAPVVAKSSDYFQIVLYTGNGSTQTISGLGFSPDLIWTKSRSRIDNNVLHDIVRGRTSNLYSDLAASENTTTTSTADLVSFDANGYTLGTVQQSAMNRSGETYVAWAWDAGSSTVTNTQGSITSQVRANASAGFSVVTYTGTGSAGTVGHGLGVKPAFYIVKGRSNSDNWCVYHTSLTANNLIFLNLTNASGASARWNNTEPTSTVFSLGTDSSVNGNGTTYVCYAFSPVAGYGNGFSYTGNGSADGPFQYLGFLPKLILIKCSSTTGNWVLLDTEREGYNVDNDPLFPNLSNAEATTDLLDITSNGFKIRSTNADVNTNAATYIGYAWAESPFQFSRAR